MALQIDSSYLTTLAILGVVLLLTFPCSFAMKGCICVGLANYIGILRRIGGMEVIFRDNPKTQNNLHWYLNSLLELGRRGVANIISCLHAITPVASTFGLQLDAHLVYSFVLQQGILEYGRSLIASSNVHMALCLFTPSCLCHSPVSRCTQGCILQKTLKIYIFRLQIDEYFKCHCQFTEKAHMLVFLHSLFGMCHGI